MGALCDRRPMRRAVLGLLVLAACGARTGFGDEVGQASPVTHPTYGEPQALSLSTSGLISTSNDGLHYTLRHTASRGLETDTFAVDDAHDTMVVFDRELVSHCSHDGGITWREGEPLTKDRSSVGLLRYASWDGIQFLATYQGRDRRSYVVSSPDGERWSPYGESDATWLHPFRTGGGMRALFFFGEEPYERVGTYSSRPIAPTGILPGADPKDTFGTTWDTVWFDHETERSYLVTVTRKDGTHQLWSTADGGAWRREPGAVKASDDPRQGYYVSSGEGVKYLNIGELGLPAPLDAVGRFAPAPDGRLYATAFEGDASGPDPRHVATGVSFDRGRTWQWNEMVLSNEGSPLSVHFIGK